MRKCILSNEMKPKKEMIRVVQNKEGEISADATGKKTGSWCLCFQRCCPS